MSWGPGNLRRQHGVALLAVLWLVAALSIMLGGLLHTVRGEIRITSLTRQSAEAAGLADAAIRLKLQSILLAGDKPIKTIEHTTLDVLGKQVGVVVAPLNGLLDINSASQSLLVDVFVYAGALDIGQAETMAKEVVLARQRLSSLGDAAGFHAPEDLLLLGGLNYDTYARLTSFLTVDSAGSGRINPLAAPLELLRVLAKGDHARAQALFAARQSNAEFMDTTNLSVVHTEIAASRRLQIQAFVVTDETAAFKRTWHVDVGASAFGLPWVVLARKSEWTTDLSVKK